jgi:hypothetical protein
MAEKFEHWGIIELMGHQRAAGRLSEEMIGGANMLRVDVPDGEAFRTAYYGASAIYAVHITDEKIARSAASGMGRRPPYAYEISRLLPAPAPEATDAENGEDDDVEF